MARRRREVAEPDRRSLALKVLHVISGDLWAGAEMQAFTLMSSLLRLNVEVAAAVMNEGELTRRLREAGVAVTVLDERQLGSRQIVGGLQDLMARWQPDVVHTHRTKENVLGSLANRLGRKVPSLRTVHGASEHAPRGLQARLRHAVISGLDSWCARHAQERLIAVSGELGTKLAALYPREKITVIVNGVDARAVLAQRHPVEFRETDATHIGIVGRLVPVKRVDLFLEAAALLQQQDPARRWRFHIFGDGPLREELVGKAARLGLQDAARFHGHRQDIVACMAALDAVIMCSDHEGLPMTALEALVLDVPLIAHAVGGLLNLVPPGRLVQQHDASGYQSAVQRMLQDPDRLGDAELRRRVLDEYSCERNAARTLALYEELVTLRATTSS
jgi:glycosyltransferase involved in cell wall biosynthesis